MKIVKWTFGVLLALAVISTFAIFCIEVSILGFLGAIEEIFDLLRAILRKPFILVPILIIMGIPFASIIVRNGDIAGSHMKHIMFGVGIMFILAVLLTPIAIWGIAGNTIEYSPYYLVKRGKYDRALKQVEKMQSGESQKTYAYQLAIDCFDKKEYSTAIAFCKRGLQDATISSSEKDSLIYLVMGDCYVGLGNHDEAKKCYSSCVKLNDSCSEVVPNSDQRIRDIMKKISEK